MTPFLIQCGCETVHWGNQDSRGAINAAILVHTSAFCSLFTCNYAHVKSSRFQDFTKYLENDPEILLLAYTAHRWYIVTQTDPEPENYKQYGEQK